MNIPVSAKEKRQPGELQAFERELVNYLRKHPDFFISHPGLLEQLLVPHDCGGAVSLVEYQISVLRDENRRLRHHLQELTSCARDNEELSRRVHRLTLSLVECDRVDEVLGTLVQVLVEEFRADSAAVRLFTRPRSPADAGLAEFVGPGSEARRHFETVLEAGRAPVCGRLKPAQLQFLFADQAAEIGSGALVPLGEPARYGVIAIGSRDARRFHPAMGTMFLRHMGEIVTRILDPHVDPNVSAA